jgi:Secretion system C-terminal sorting domain
MISLSVQNRLSCKTITAPPPPVKSFLHAVLKAALIFLLFYGTIPLQAQSNCSSGNLLTFKSIDYYDGYYYLEVVWQNPPDGLNGMNFNVSISPSTGVDFDPDTFESIHPAFENEGYSLGISGGTTLTFSGFHPASPIDMTAFSSGVVLFSVRFTGDPDECYTVDFGGVLKYLAEDTTEDPPYYPCDLNTSNSEELCFGAVNISGLVESPLSCSGSEDHGVPDVIVDILRDATDEVCSETTAADGTYDCDVVPEADYRILPSKDDNPGCGITSTDDGILYQHLLGNNYFEDPYELFAGDLSGNRVVSSYDRVVMYYVLLENFEQAMSLGFRAWDFIPASDYVTVDDPLAPATYNLPDFDHFIDLTDLDDDATYQDFIGIKVGDINASCTECSEEFNGGGTEDRGEIAFRNINLEHANLREGLEATFTFTTEKVEDLTFYLMGVNFSPEYFEVVEVLKPQGLPDGFFGYNQPAYEPGLTLLLWSNLDDLPASTSVLASFKVRVKKVPEDLWEAIKLSGRENVLYKNNAWEEPEYLQINPVRLPPADFEHSVYPNPANEDAFISFQLPETGNVSLALYDGYGKEVLIRQQIYDAGTHRVLLTPAGHLASGVYFYRIEWNGTRQNGKLIISQ